MSYITRLIAKDTKQPVSMQVHRHAPDHFVRENGVSLQTCICCSNSIHERLFCICTSLPINTINLFYKQSVVSLVCVDCKKLNSGSITVEVSWNSRRTRNRFVYGLLMNHKTAINEYTSFRKHIWGTSNVNNVLSAILSFVEHLKLSIIESSKGCSRFPFKNFRLLPKSISN